MNKNGCKVTIIKEEKEKLIDFHNRKIALLKEKHKLILLYRKWKLNLWQNISSLLGLFYFVQILAEASSKKFFPKEIWCIFLVMYITLLMVIIIKYHFATRYPKKIKNVSTKISELDKKLKLTLDKI